MLAGIREQLNQQLTDWPGLASESNNYPSWRKRDRCSCIRNQLDRAGELAERVAIREFVFKPQDHTENYVGGKWSQVILIGETELMRALERGAKIMWSAMGADLHCCLSSRLTSH